MKKLIGIFLGVLLALVPATSALALTTQDVTVTATPSFVSISNTPNTYNFGNVATSTNYSTSQGYFYVTNTSSATTNVTIGVTSANWTGGTQWISSDTGTPAADTAALWASENSTAFNVIVKNVAPNDIVNGKAANTNWAWELRLATPTSFADGVQKTITVRLTASTS